MIFNLLSKNNKFILKISVVKKKPTKQFVIQFQKNHNFLTSNHNLNLQTCNLSRSA